MLSQDLPALFPSAAARAVELFINVREMGAEQPATVAGRRAVIRGELKQRLHTQHEQREQQHQYDEQVKSLAQDAFLADEREVHRRLKSEAKWFAAALCSALLVAAFAKWEGWWPADDVEGAASLQRGRD